MSRSNRSSAAVCAIVFTLAGAACEKTEPSPRPEPVPAPTPVPVLDAGTLDTSACYTVVVRLDRDGTWIGAPTDVRCYAPFLGGNPDTAWLEATLHRLRTRIDATCRPTVELGAVAGISYAQIVNVFATVRTTGFAKLDFVEPSALAMTFDATHRTAHCTGTLDTNKDARKPKPERRPPPPQPMVGGGGGDLRPTRRLAISRDAIYFNSERLVAIADLPRTGTLAPIAKALGTPTDDNYSTVILSPDGAIDAALLHRIVATVKSAGYDHIAFETAP